MATELKKFSEAYATMTVAAYEPLIFLRWVSLYHVRVIANTLAWRYSKAKAIHFDPAHPTAISLSTSIRRGLPRNIDVDFKRVDRPTAYVDQAGNPVSSEGVTPVHVPGYPDAVLAGNQVILRGLTASDPAGFERSPAGVGLEAGGKVRFSARAWSSALARAGAVGQVLKSIPTLVGAKLGSVDKSFKFADVRDRLQSNLVAAAREWVAHPGGSLADVMGKVTAIDNVVLPHFWPGAFLEQALSPIGIAHYYRQLYFNGEEGVGPLEEAFTIAPLETLEVVYQTVRRQIHEEVLEQGLEIVSEAATEEKNLDEVSDKVSSMIQQDTSAAMSATASGGTPVFQFGASASASFAVSSQRGQELSTRRLKEVTKRASERITKTFSIKTRDIEDVTTTNLTRRVIKNDSEHPVSYGLRRVLRRVKVKVQDLGPRLVWQLYLRNPGEGLARSRFVHFREAEPIAVPEIPPGVPPRPKGGTDTGSVQTDLRWNAEKQTYFVAITVNPGPDRVVTAVRIDTISDLEGGGKDDPAPSARNDVDLGPPTYDAGTNTFTAYIAVLEGDAASVQVNYSYSWDPSQAVLDDWEKLRQDAVNKLQEEELNKQFEQQKTLITERSKIKSRPANDLRKEERYEVMNRMVSHLFGRGDSPSEPTPLEIESFHRFFDIDGIFVYNHPSWWRPRYASKAGFDRPAYEITAESEPAPLGSSLGWIIQLDGDRRRNEFLNSPWVRICTPMRPGREREAIQWLARHVEGDVGFNTGAGPLKDLLDQIEAFRGREGKLGLNGADYVKVDSTPGAPADPATPEGVYPVIEEFEVTMPTDGFVYDELTVVTS